MRNADHWRSEVLDEIFEAFAGSEELVEHLIFKGARVLARRLPSVKRQSLDIDSNLAEAFLEKFPSVEERRQVLERGVARALRNHFDGQNPVRYQVDGINLKAQPPKGHPRGWNAFVLRIRIRDLSKPEVLAHSFPAFEVDIAAPEALLKGSVASLRVGGRSVRAYTLQRMAGEKLRAFLSSLPAYRAKLSRPGEAVRAKDLHDEALILRARPLPKNAGFWREAGREFRSACESRYVDCKGMESFQENWDVTRQTYSNGTIIGGAVAFDEAARALSSIVRFFSDEGVVPFSFDLPPIGTPR